MLLARETSNQRRMALLELQDGCCKLIPYEEGQRTLQRILREAFLPEGYPSSVTEDYFSFQLWDSIQALSSYVRGILSSQAMLAGVGVGRATATPLSAALQFFWRDFTGMLAGICFATYQGSGLDAFAKQWRLFADVANDLGLALELASPLFPGAFLLLACLGSVCRAVVGVAGGATRMALTQHFALQRNAADIAAKEGSQETATTLVGMMLGMLFTSSASSSPLMVWTLFVVLTAVHVYANVRAMRCLRITSLNQSRLALLLRSYIAMGKVPTPAQMAGQESLVPPPVESLLWRLGWRRREPRVVVAPSLVRLSPQARRHVAEALVSAQLAQDSTQRFLVTVPPDSPVDGALLLLRADAATPDVLQGYCVALLRCWDRQLQACASQAQGQLGGRGRAVRREESWPSSARLTLAKSASWAAQDFSAFLDALVSSGWAVERVALGQGTTRLEWGAVLKAD